MQCDQQVSHWANIFILSTEKKIFYIKSKIHDLKVKLSTYEETKKETLNSLSDKSKETSILKSEINGLKSANGALKQQVRVTAGVLLGIWIFFELNYI